jgi:hypothetical protein
MTVPATWARYVLENAASTGSAPVERFGRDQPTAW